MKTITTTLIAMVVVAITVSPAVADMTITVPGTATVHFAGQTSGEMPLTSGEPSPHNTFHTDGSNPDTLPPFIDARSPALGSVPWSGLQVVPGLT